MEETNSTNQPQQPQNINAQFNSPSTQMPTPNSVAVLVLGILSIVFCFCYGFIGLILGIIALVLASKGNTAYLENPNAYTLASYNNLKAGKICAIIGTCLSSLYLIIVVLYLVIIGTALSTFSLDQFIH